VEAGIKLLERFRFVLEELKRFEEKFKMSSEEFYRKWTSGEIAEPEDPPSPTSRIPHMARPNRRV